MKSILYIVAAILSLFPFPNKENMNLTKIDNLFERIFPEGEPGGAVLILQGESVIYNNCRGLADMETGESITDSTLFNIASVSKQFTSVGVLQLADKGLLSLDDPVHKFFPEFTSDIWDRVQLKHLLSHSSGVPDERGYLSRKERIFGDDNLATEYLKELDHLHFEPGTAYEYINPTYTLLGKVIERVSGMPFVDYMQKYVLDPAGMNSSYYFDPELMKTLPRCSHAYINYNENWHEYDYGEETFFGTRPDGGLYTNVKDFVKWELALRSGKVLRDDLVALAHSPVTLISGSPWSDYQNRPNTWYGYGWFIEPKTAATPLVVYHTGDNGGYQILAARYPESEILVLIFSNRSDWDRYGAKMEIQSALGF